MNPDACGDNGSHFPGDEYPVSLLLEKPSVSWFPTKFSKVSFKEMYANQKGEFTCREQEWRDKKYRELEFYYHTKYT